MDITILQNSSAYWARTHCVVSKALATHFIWWHLLAGTTKRVRFKLIRVPRYPFS